MLIAAVVLPMMLNAQEIADLLPKAQGGDVKAMFEVAELYRNSWDDGAEKNALTWYNKAADKGNGDAMLKLYEAYKWGSLGLESNDDKAAQWLDKAVAVGNAAALYTKGESIMFDDETKGLKLITQGAEKGNADAQLYLAKHYNNSWGNSYNPATAFKWVKMSAEQDNAEAQYMLATFYLKGIGTSPNKAEGVKWLKKAAENEFSTAAEIIQWL